MTPTCNPSVKSPAESPQSSISMPNSFLAPTLVGPMTWSGAEWNQLKSRYNLNDAEIINIRAAIIHFNLLRLPRSAINKTTFPLKADLSTKLRSLSAEAHNGSGVAVLRGLDSANLNDEEAVIAFAGICSHIAPLRATDSYANQTLSHVRDASRDSVPFWAKDIGLAGSKIPIAMDFHSDRFSGDLLALHVRDDGGAKTGGEQYGVSFWSIYNELLATNPTVLETMAEANWPFELKQKDQKPYLELGPILFFSHGKPIVQLVKAPLLGTPLIKRDVSMPALSKVQLHTLQVVEDLAKKHCTKLERRKGDIQIINNLSIMHARAAYGSKNQHSTRHLLRMFLRDPANEWEKSQFAAFRKNFDDPFTHGRQQNLPVMDLDPWRAISGCESHG